MTIDHSLTIPPLIYWSGNFTTKLYISKLKKSIHCRGGSVITFIYEVTLTPVLQFEILPFNPSPLRLNIFRLFVILSLTQLYRYTPEIFLFAFHTKNRGRHIRQKNNVLVTFVDSRYIKLCFWGYIKFVS
jgi:hypothetical protein